jgi:hypothetical protein
MTKKLSNKAWLRAANTSGKGPVDERLKALARFLARRAAEADYENAQRSGNAYHTDSEEDLEP